MTLSFSRLRWAPWMLGFAAAAVMWLTTLAFAHGQGGLETIAVTLAFSVFTVTAGTGQMFVIASGPGNIDLSLPAVITLSAYLSMGAMHGSAALLPLGLVIAIGVGIVAGAGNYLLIRLLRIPAIIATLASSFIFQSLAMNAGGEATIKPPGLLADFTVLRLGGVQILLVIAILGSVTAHVVVRRTIFGRHLLAVGQNDRAAALAGIDIDRIRVVCYAISGALAGLTGFLLSGFTGGAALNMGDSYLMESIAVVVLGGTSVAGGRANALGIWGAALFFNLLTTMINAFHLDAGWRFVLTGTIIIAVVAVASDDERG